MSWRFCTNLYPYCFITALQTLWTCRILSKVKLFIHGKASYGSSGLFGRLLFRYCSISGRDLMPKKSRKSSTEAWLINWKSSNLTILEGKKNFFRASFVGWKPFLLESLRSKMPKVEGLDLIGPFFLAKILQNICSQGFTSRISNDIDDFSVHRQPWIVENFAHLYEWCSNGHDL